MESTTDEKKWKNVFDGKICKYPAVQWCRGDQPGLQSGIPVAEECIRYQPDNWVHNKPYINRATDGRTAAGRSALNQVSLSHLDDFNHFR